MDQKVYRLCFSLLLLLFGYSSFGQFTIQLNVTDASCTNNGIIDIDVTGGSGDFIFSILSECGAQISPRREARFTSLSPCNKYVVFVTDEQTQVVVKDSVSLNSNYINPSLEIIQDGCTFSAVVTGGTGPFIYRYSDRSFGNLSTIQDSILPFTNRDSVFVEIEDICGTIAGRAESTKDQAVVDFFTNQDSSGMTFTPIGGIPGYNFQLTSTLGIFNSQTGFFPWSEIGCDPIISISDTCGTTPFESNNIEISINVVDHCVNFSEGTAQIDVEPGRAPITIQFENQTNTDGQFTGLPIFSRSYNFEIEDACGLELIPDFSLTNYRLRLEPATDPCNETDLIFTVGRDCTGELQYPINIDCISCPNGDNFIINDPTENMVEFTGLNPGEWELKLTDACGEEIDFKDTVIVEIVTACDSIIAEVINSFVSSANLGDRRTIDDPSLRYALFDESGALIEANNQSGIFTNLSEGTYTVEATINCGTISATAQINAPEPIDPYIETFVEYTTLGSNCNLIYDVFIDKAQGPYVLKGGPTGNFKMVLNNYDQDNCTFYVIEDLPAGEYELVSMALCGSYTLNLPAIDLNRIDTVEVEANCPSDATINVDGDLWNTQQWYDWFLSQGIVILNQEIDDQYIINGISYTENRITGLEPDQTYSIQYVPGFATANCVGDSETFSIGPYVAPNLEILDNIVCDEDQEATLRLPIIGSAPSFILNNVNCGASNTLPFEVEYTSADTLIFPNTALGNYCIAIRDVCLNSANYQFEVGYFTDDVRQDYICDSTVALSVVEIPVPIEWFDEAGNTFATGNQTSVELPDENRDLSLTIDLSRCQIQRSFTVLPRVIFPTLEILNPTDSLTFCVGESLALNISTEDAAGIFWNGQPGGESFIVTQPGTYTVEVFSDINCSVSSQLTTSTQEAIPEIQGPEGICDGESIELRLRESFPIISWSNGSTTPNTTLITAGDYSVSVIDNLGCQGIADVSIQQWLLPDFMITGETLICQNELTPVATSPTFPAYSWSNGSTNGQLNVGSGTYEVTVTDQNGCQNNSQITIEERPEVNAFLSGDTIVCEGDPVILNYQLTGLSGPTNVNLNLPSGGTSSFEILNSNSTITLIPPASGPITLAEVTLDQYPCPILLNGSANITVQALPAPDLGGIEGLCKGEEGIITLSLNTDFPLIRWSTGAIDTLAILVDIPGWYIVEAEDELGCIGADSVLIADWELPDVMITGDPEICFESTTPLSTNERFVSYLWSDSTTTPTIVVGEGTYKVTVTDENDCQNSASFEVIECPPLLVEIGENRNIELGDTLVISPVLSSNAKEITEVSWIANDALVEDQSRLIMDGYQPLGDTFLELIIVDDNDCIASDFTFIDVEIQPKIFVPNAFSPNGDDINDQLILFGKEEQIQNINYFRIFNRWGNLMFEQLNFTPNDRTRGWDGRYRGQAATSATYIWTAEVELINGIKHLRSGSVVLIR